MTDKRNCVVSQPAIHMSLRVGDLSLPYGSGPVNGSSLLPPVNCPITPLQLEASCQVTRVARGITWVVPHGGGVALWPRVAR